MNEDPCKILNETLGQLPMNRLIQAMDDWNTGQISVSPLDSEGNRLWAIIVVGAKRANLVLGVLQAVDEAIDGMVDRHVEIPELEE